MISSVGAKAGCKPALGCALLTERSRWGSEATICHSHLKHLSKLAEALEENALSKPQHLGATDTLQFVEQLSDLKQQWAADDAASKAAQEAAANRPELKRGMKMVGDALEIDFSVYEDSDDEEDEDLPSVKRLPREVKYFDTARIHVRAGDGGTGCCAFRREKFISHGGPAGGNGGNGGSIWVVAEEGMTSLLPFRNTVHWKAKSGANGGGKDMHGANALDTYIKVPPGVIIRRKDADEDEPPLAELINSGELSHMPSAVF
jgi:hypothetical protein